MGVTAVRRFEATLCSETLLLYSQFLPDSKYCWSDRVSINKVDRLR